MFHATRSLFPQQPGTVQDCCDVLFEAVMCVHIDSPVAELAHFTLHMMLPVCGTGSFSQQD